MRATLKDIAEATGLSVSSVSLVLNDRPNRISEKKRKLILEKAQELHYRPNQSAVSLITKRSMTIGLILPDITNTFFAQIAKGAETRSRELGYSLMLCNTNDSPEKDEDYIHVLLGRGVDGILLVSSYRPGNLSDQSSLLDHRNQEKPIVLLDRSMNKLSASQKVSGIFADNELGGYLATEHLISQGHTRIGCITGPMGAASSKNRLFGHIRAMQTAGLVFDSSLVREGNFHTETGYILAKQLLDQGVTGIFACNDMMAYGVYRAASERGLRIPEDLSVIGFDDLPFSQIVDPPLTSVRQSAYDMGVAAVDKVIRMIKNDSVVEPIAMMSPELVLRGSTQICKGPVQSNQEKWNLERMRPDLKKILNFGSLNLDMVYSVPHFVKAGETLAATKMEVFPGGKGLNQSVALSRAGACVYHGGKIASDGVWLKGILEQSGGDAHFVLENGSATGTAIIQVEPSGENCIMINHGANYEITAEEIETAFADFRAGDLLLLQNEINHMPLLMRTAEEKGMEIALNPSPIDETLRNMDLSAVTYLILNEIEGEALTGRKQPEEICEALLQKYPKMKIVLTLGSHGVYYRDADQVEKQGICQVKAVDTTAAGDTFTGYFLALIMEGKPVAEALSMATRASALAVSKMGAAASIPLRAEVERADLIQQPWEVD